jgi:HSP20 family protein
MGTNKMYLTRYNSPAFARRRDWLFDRFFNDTVGTSADVNAKEVAHFVPRVDVAEEADAYVLHVSVPGLKKEDFKLDLTENRLTVSGERKFEAASEGKTWHTVETRYGRFTRVFRLPADVVASGIEASYTDGILVIRVPKDSSKPASQHIEVK